MEERGLNRDLDQSCIWDDKRPFIGDPCRCAGDCAFWAQGREAFCHPSGFCSLSCEGYCPDLYGRPSTFCVKDEASSISEVGGGASVLGGICVPMAVEENGRCADLPLTLDLEAERFIGSSNALDKSALVCLPR